MKYIEKTGNFYKKKKISIENSLRCYKAAALETTSPSRLLPRPAARLVCIMMLNRKIRKHNYDGLHAVTFIGG